MSGLNLHTGEENQPQYNIADQLQDQARVRAEIEKQIETEQAQARTQQQARTSQYAASYTQTRENVQQNYVPQNQTRKRAFGMDALALCALTLGIGTFLSPMMHPAPAPIFRTASVLGGYGAPISFPGSIWNLNGTDAAGTNWNDSTINFDTATARPDGLQDVTGHFDWQANSNPVGTEEFSGTYDPATHELHVSGGDIQQIDAGIGTRLVDGEYTFQMGSDGKTILGGEMHGQLNGPAAVPGTFDGGMKLK